MELRPVQRVSASAAVFDALLGELLEGSLEPGENLPAERVLTEKLQVNRQAVREALQRLSQAGLIRINQGEPTRALDYRRAASLDLLMRLLVHPDGSIDVGVARSIVEMRAAIGPDVARLAARRAPAGSIQDLAVVLTAMDEAADDLSELARLDLRFWDILVDGCDNIAYRLAFNSLRKTYEPMAEALSPVLQEELSDSAGHHALRQAVSSGDETAAEEAARRLLAKGSVAMAQMLALDGR